MSHSRWLQVMATVVVCFKRYMAIPVCCLAWCGRVGHAFLLCGFVMVVLVSPSPYCILQLSLEYVHGGYFIGFLAQGGKQSNTLKSEHKPRKTAATPPTNQAHTDCVFRNPLHNSARR